MPRRPTQTAGGACWQEKGRSSPPFLGLGQGADPPSTKLACLHVRATEHRADVGLPRAFRDGATPALSISLEKKGGAAGNGSGARFLSPRRCPSKKALTVDPRLGPIWGLAAAGASPSARTTRREPVFL